MKLPGALAKLDEAGYQLLSTQVGLGKGDTAVAKALQAAGYCTSTKLLTLRASITKWRKGRGQELVLLDLAKKMTTADGRLKKQVDIIEEMSALIEKQKARVAKVSKNEDANPMMLLGMVSDEIKTLFTMLEKLGRLQLDTGLMRKVRVGETAEDYADYEEVDGGEVVEFTEEDRRLLEIARAEVEG